MNIINNNTILYNKKIAITGEFSRLTRKQLKAVIKAFGGIPINHVSNKTDILLISNYAKYNTYKSEKKDKAKELRAKGNTHLKVMAESYFYNLTQVYKYSDFVAQYLPTIKEDY